MQFVKFLKAALNQASPEFDQLYKHLFTCFINADKNFDGLVNITEFFKLIDVSSAAPRSLGLAPTVQDMEKKMGLEWFANSRNIMFNDLLKPGGTGVTFDSWLTFCLAHIQEHVKFLEVKEPGYTGTGEEFQTFFKNAVNKDSNEWKDLYHFLLKHFINVDLDRDGTIGYHEFDQLLHNVTKTLKQFGFPTDLTGKDRIAFQSKLFHNMDKNNDSSINFHEWLDYMHQHLSSKVAAL